MKEEENFDIEPARFDELVDEALKDLPPEFVAHLRNVQIVTEAKPSRKLLREMGMSGKGEDTLLGLYQGTSLTERTSDYGNVLPDRILLYREPILDEAYATQQEDESFEDAVRAVVRDTVLHEVGHHFGMGEEELDDLGYG
jgi:predicted Zn-dependent protease with MMP-like domain